MQDGCAPPCLEGGEGDFTIVLPKRTSRLSLHLNMVWSTLNSRHNRIQLQIIPVGFLPVLLINSSWLCSLESTFPLRSSSCISLHCTHSCYWEESLCPMFSLHLRKCRSINVPRDVKEICARQREEAIPCASHCPVWDVHFSWSVQQILRRRLLRGYSKKCFGTKDEKSDVRRSRSNERQHHLSEHELKMKRQI